MLSELSAPNGSDIEELVAGVSVVDGVLSFDNDTSELEQISAIEGPNERSLQTAMRAEADLDATPSQVTITTARMEGPEAAALWAAVNDSPDLEEVSIGGRPG